VWAVPGRFFQSLPVPCGASPDVTDSREKRNQGQSDFLRQKIFGDLEFALRVSKTQKDLGNFRIWFSGYGFQDLGSQLWGLGNFRIWFSGHGFQDLGSQL
jgi:peptidoglycan hydrolase-like protein with peptidoglycan-binding domain